MEQKRKPPVTWQGLGAGGESQGLLYCGKLDTCTFKLLFPPPLPNSSARGQNVKKLYSGNVLASLPQLSIWSFVFCRANWADVTYWDNGCSILLFAFCVWRRLAMWNCYTCNGFIPVLFLRGDMPTGAAKVWKLIIWVHIYSHPFTDTCIHRYIYIYTHPHTTTKVTYKLRLTVERLAILMFHCLGLHLILADQASLWSPVTMIALKSPHIPAL